MTKKWTARCSGIMAAYQTLPQESLTSPYSHLSETEAASSVKPNLIKLIKDRFLILDLWTKEGFNKVIMENEKISKHIKGWKNEGENS